MGEIRKLFSADYSVRIHLIGEFRVIGTGGENITPTASKARGILAILALSENGEIPRDTLIELLWSRHAREQAQASLRQSLSVLRRTFRFEEQDFFTADRNKVRLKKGKLWLDSDEIVNNTSELLKNNQLTNLCCGLALKNLEANDPAFKSWLDIKKQALEENIKSTLLARLTKTSEDNVDTKKHKAILESLKNIDPSANPVPLDEEEKKVENNPRGETCLARDEQLYRNCLLKKVLRFWIEGILEQSLYKKIRIELQLNETSEQMLQAWKDAGQYSVSSSMRDSNAGINKLRSNSEIGKIFTELDESLLILGAPGSGKTTLLLCLAQQLLEQAEEDSSHPIPVVFHLSTWAKDRSSLDDWLEDELEIRYQMPRKQSAELIRNHGILPLLDGLDEVDARDRADCVGTINNYRQQNTWLSMVVCSREEEYKNLPLPLITTGKVLIHALTESQCDTYLQAIEEPHRGLNVALAENKQLKELLTTPLMLNIAGIAYQDYTENTLPPAEPHCDVKDRLFSAYTQTMLSRRTPAKDSAHYSKDDTCHWLTCLARSLDEEKQSIFYLDSIQPGRLSAAKQYWMVTQGSVMICALSTALSLGLMGGLVMPLKYSLGIALVSGIIGGYITGLLGYGNLIKPVTNIKPSWTTLRNVSAIKQIGTVAVTGIVGLSVGLVFGPVPGGMMGLLFYILLLFVNSLDFDLDYERQALHADPNGDIHRSLRNAGIALTVAGAAGFISASVVTGLEGAMTVGILAALLSALFFGAHACIQHYLLRYFLWWNNSAPLNYVRFLEFSVDRIFLYRVGRGYIFIHRSLAEYFAKN